MLKDDCLFCKIIRGEIPSAKVYEDDKMLVFKDIEPKAKVHLLAVPKDHFKLLSEMDEKRAELVKYMLEKIPQIAAENGSTTVSTTTLSGSPLLGSLLNSIVNDSLEGNCGKERLSVFMAKHQQTEK